MHWIKVQWNANPFKSRFNWVHFIFKLFIFYFSFKIFNNHFSKWMTRIDFFKKYKFKKFKKSFLYKRVSFCIFKKKFSKNYTFFTFLRFFPSFSQPKSGIPKFDARYGFDSNWNLILTWFIFILVAINSQLILLLLLRSSNSFQYLT